MNNSFTFDKVHKNDKESFSLKYNEIILTKPLLGVDNEELGFLPILQYVIIIYFIYLNKK